MKKFRESFWKQQGWMVETRPRVWVKKSRFLIEQSVGRPLMGREEVHYLDGNYRNCTLPNLIVKDFINKIEWWLDIHGNQIRRSLPLWSRKYSECKACQSTLKPYKALGFCTYCYQRDYWAPKH